jgi:hypothetical protein
MRDPSKNATSGRHDALAHASSKSSVAMLTLKHSQAVLAAPAPVQDQRGDTRVHRDRLQQPHGAPHRDVVRDGRCRHGHAQEGVPRGGQLVGYLGAPRTEPFRVTGCRVV